MKRRGLFVGLSTLDCIYLAKNIPATNQKTVALDQTIAAGGPATNAAVTFSYLGDRAILLSAIGTHPLSQIIRADLETYAVELIDLDPHRIESPSVSSIIVTQSTGERAVISVNATKVQANPAQIPVDILEGVEIVLIDGHQMTASIAIARQAQSRNIPVAIDGGSWKPDFDKVLPNVDYAICSDNFYPPDCSNQQDVFSYLQNMGIPYIAITQGDRPIRYSNRGEFGAIEIPAIAPIDTSGAGDIFHGAFCRYILDKSFTESLSLAAQLASHSCQFFGTRQWMQL